MTDGFLTINDGTYNLFGQTLMIERGLLVFNGPLDNPGIDFRIVRDVDEVTVGMNVSGTLVRPTSSVFSNPPMSDTEAFSYLLLGRSLRRKLSLVTYIFICYGSAAVILWVIVLSLRFPITGFSPGTVAAFWGMALVAQIIGHSTYNWALRWLSAGLIAISLLGEPIGSTILAYLIFDEGLTVYKVVGGVIILSAIYLAASTKSRSNKK